MIKNNWSLNDTINLAFLISVICIIGYGVFSMILGIENQRYDHIIKMQEKCDQYMGDDVLMGDVTIDCYSFIQTRFRIKT